MRTGKFPKTLLGSHLLNVYTAGQFEDLWTSSRSRGRSPRSGDNVVSYVLAVQQKLASMSDVVRENLGEAQRRQKVWYDQNACQREFKPGDLVLVLLPTSAGSLTAQWQGPYPVLHRIGSVKYLVDMHDLPCQHAKEVEHHDVWELLGRGRQRGLDRGGRGDS